MSSWKTALVLSLGFGLAVSCARHSASSEGGNVSKAAAVPALGSGFETSDALPAGWTSEGNVSIDRQAAFKGTRSLVLRRAADEVEKACSVTTSSFPVKPGIWKIALAARADLKSPDNSFNGVVSLQYLDAAGKVLDAVTLADIFGQKNWQPLSRRVEVPEQAAAARFHVQLNKASGQFWIDELSASFVSVAVQKDSRIERIVFATAQSGNLLFPDDKRTVTVEVRTNRPLDASQQQLSYVVRDYWGAECSSAGKVALAAPKPEDNKLIYQAVIDLSGVPLEMGRYYELHAELPQQGQEPFRNYTSLAILPQPITKQYKPMEIPFTSRNWDGRQPAFFYLADRIGVRITNVWGGWSVTPPYTPKADTIEVAEKLGMGVINGTPAGIIEQRRPGWEKITEKDLKGGVAPWIEKYGKVRPLMFTMGNEPPALAERVSANVAAYKAIYEEVKRVDPSIIVIASSVGPAESFFKGGFHKYCDVVDFHAYEDWKGIRETFRAYDRLFATYGNRKPIWSTEIGLNSQGLARQTVAATLVKKITSFFAGGGVSVSWFNLGYPDPDCKIVDDATTAHNAFDCRYARYCPKLDAIAYYNMINGICVKKFVAEKVYDSDIYAFLFRDRDNHCLQVIWKEKGRRDVLLPLPGVGKVTAIDIDGRRSDLAAGGKGLTLTVNEDPMLLLYDSADAPLADKLGEPAAKVVSLPEGVVKGASARLSLALGAGVSAERVELLTPLGWKTTRGTLASGQGGVLLPLALSVPETSSIREGAVAVRIKDGNGGYSGELRTRIPVTGRVGLRLLPSPVADGKPAGVRLVVQNFSPQKEEVNWKMELTSEMPMAKGAVGAPISPNAYFADAAEGTLKVDGNGEASIVVPLAGLDPLSAYRVKASITESSGRTTEAERFLAGFVNVPHARSLKMDGSLSEPEWRSAPVTHIGDPRQFYPFGDAKWKGPADLSGTVQFLWDEKYLYVGVKVTDDAFANKKVDGELWNGDGLQFLVDPARANAFKPGKYDIAVAKTAKGPQAWCFLSADALAPSGEIKDMILSMKSTDPARGDMTYELAIPWSRVAPFHPAAGANLGLGIVLNEDDGPGRVGFLSWFADVQGKTVDTVADLVLGK